MSVCENEQLHYHQLPESDAWRDGAAEALIKLSQRAIPARQLIVERIAELERPFSAEELVEEFVTKAALTGRATIYRTLDWLRTAGWVSRLQHGDSVTYTRTLPGHHHSVICRSCGASLLLGGCDLDALLAPVLSASGFVIEGHRLELYGQCERCRAV